MKLRERISDVGFKHRHRRDKKWFERERKLPFVLMIILILRKSAKSVQNVLNEIAPNGHPQVNDLLVTASAFSQARQHLAHTAFIELNQSILLPACYQDKGHRRYAGYRVLAGDGSPVRLPDHKSVRKMFGVLPITNGRDATIAASYACSHAFVLHDVLNKVVVHAQMGVATAYEVDQAVQALTDTQAGDLLLFDRNFASYPLLAHLTQQQRQFVIRCSTVSFQTARQLFAADVEESRLVWLEVPPKQKAQVQALGLPCPLWVRFVAVRLDSGELEVLVTSLCDEVAFPTATFKTLYYLRWGVETLYDVLKTRLSLENFSGKTAAAVLQDFHATIFLTGLESLLTAEADDRLAQRSQHNQLGQTVNNMVSFHAIKHHALQLLASDAEPGQIVDRLTALFLLNPTYTRRNRQPPRRRSTHRVILNFWRYRRKVCF